MSLSAEKRGEHTALNAINSARATNGNNWRVAVPPFQFWCWAFYLFFLSNPAFYNQCELLLLLRASGPDFFSSSSAFFNCNQTTTCLPLARFLNRFAHCSPAVQQPSYCLAISLQSLLSFSADDQQGHLDYSTSTPSLSHMLGPLIIFPNPSFRAVRTLLLVFPHSDMNRLLLLQKCF